MSDVFGMDIVGSSEWMGHMVFNLADGSIWDPSSANLDEVEIEGFKQDIIESFPDLFPPDTPEADPEYYDNLEDLLATLKPQKTNIDLSLFDRLQYPVLAKIIDGLYNKVKDDQKLMNVLKNFTNMTEAQILEKLKSGQGPKLYVENNPYRAGSYDPDTNTMYVSQQIITAQNYMVKDFSTALEFYISVTILHEFIHYGEDYTQTFRPHEGGQDDAGFQFENEMYGGKVYFNYATGEITYEKL